MLRPGTIVPDVSKAENPVPSDASASSAVATRLFGDLRCIGCGYNLRGLSIRSACPECGASVRATLLAVVDPRAEELAPVRAPRLMAWAFVFWSMGALVAGLAIWTLRIADVIEIWADVTVPIELLGSAAVVAASASGAASLALIRPHRRGHGGSAINKSWRAAFGVLCYAPLVYLLVQILLRHDPMHGSPLDMFADPLDTERLLLRVGVWAALGGVVWGLEPNVQQLRRRSLLMRTGRVTPQPMSALLAALALAAVADLLVLAVSLMNGVAMDIAATLNLVAVAVGAFLLTLGIVALVLEGLRLRGAIVRRPVGVTDVFDPAKNTRP